MVINIYQIGIQANLLFQIILIKGRLSGFKSIETI